MVPIIPEAEPEVGVTVVLVVVPGAVAPVVDMIPPSCSRTRSRSGSGTTMRDPGDAVPRRVPVRGAVDSPGFEVAVVVAPPKVSAVVFEPTERSLPTDVVDMMPVEADVDDVEPTAELESDCAAESESDCAADSPFDSDALSPTTIIGSRSAAACPPVNCDTTHTARLTTTSTSTAGRSRDVARVFTSSSIPTQSKGAVRIS